MEELDLSHHDSDQALSDWVDIDLEVTQKVHQGLQRVMNQALTLDTQTSGSSPQV